MDVFVVTFFALMFGHALADFPLQGDFLARAKNQSAPIPGVPAAWAMTMHVTIHAGFVLMITDSWALAGSELFLHWMIDSEKNHGRISFAVDQALHVLCKAMWAAIVAISGGMLP